MQLIADFCQNHNGDFEILKDMIYAAQENGADYAKIQNIFASMVTFRERFEEGLVENGIVKVIKRPYRTEYERLKKLELTYEQQRKFIELCKKAGIKPLVTVFTRDAVSVLRNLGFEDIKIASYDSGSVPLLRDIKKRFNGIFVSTGATFDEEIPIAAEALNGSNFTFLHCVTIYPTPLEKFNLARMDFLRRYSQKVGWSDHSLVGRDGIKGTIAAIYYGADIIERHFTILPEENTKDGPISIGPEQLKELRNLSKYSKHELELYLKEWFPEFPKTWGSLSLGLSPEELLNRDYYRGRFASLQSDGKYVYNWEDVPMEDS